MCDQFTGLLYTPVLEKAIEESKQLSSDFQLVLVL